MKNSNYITYGKGVQDDDHVWYVPLSQKSKITDLKDTAYDVSTIEGAVGLGEVSEEGVAETPGYGEPEAVRNQSGSPVTHSDGDFEPSTTFSLMQTGGDIEVDKVIYGAENVTGTINNYTIKKNSNNKATGIFVIDTMLDNGGKERTIYPNAVLKLSDDVVDNYTDVRLYPVTLTPSVDEFGQIAYTVKSAKVEG